MHDQNIKEIIARLAARGSNKNDVEKQLESWMSRNSVGEGDLSQALHNVPIAGIPANWGGGPFDALLQNLKDTLENLDIHHFQIQDVAERYEIFNWGYELVPSVGLFPLFLTPERAQSWTVMQIGRQRRIAMVFPSASEARYKRQLRLASKSEHSPVRISASAFEKLIYNFRESPSQRVHFYYFGPGHIAAKILASSLKDVSNRQYFLNTLDHYETVSRVVDRRVRKGLEIAQSNNFSIDRDFPDAFENFRNDPSKMASARTEILNAAISGLTSALHDHSTFQAVITDLGVAEFLALKKEANLTVWEIEHGMDIPVGIGLSMPSLIRMSTARNVFNVLDERIDEWLASIFDKGHQHSIFEEFGIELERPSGRAAERPQWTKPLLPLCWRKWFRFARATCRATMVATRLS